MSNVRDRRLIILLPGRDTPWRLGLLSGFVDTSMCRRMKDSGLNMKPGRPRPDELHGPVEDKPDGDGGKKQPHQPIHDIDAGSSEDPADRVRRDQGEPDAAR